MLSTTHHTHREAVSCIHLTEATARRTDGIRRVVVPDPSSDVAGLATGGASAVGVVACDGMLTR